MAMTIPRALKQAMDRPVLVVNDGDKTVLECFDGQWYRFRPKTAVYVPAERAWCWFGNPLMRSHETGGGVREWDREMRLLEERCGPEMYKYRLDGFFYCKEFGRGREWFYQNNRVEVAYIEAEPIDIAMLNAVEADEMPVMPAPPSVLPPSYTDGKGFVTMDMPRSVNIPIGPQGAPMPVGQGAPLPQNAQEAAIDAAFRAEVKGVGQADPALMNAVGLVPGQVSTKFSEGSIAKPKAQL
jgi:hypothetical protein